MTIRPELTTGPFDPATITAVEQLAEVAEQSDGAPPFSEQSLVMLRRGESAVVLVTIASTQRPRQLDAAAVVVLSETDHDVMEMVVHPHQRRSGLGTAIAETLAAAELGDTTPRAWAHGAHPGAAKLAARFGWQTVRQLRRMRLENSVEIASHTPPEGVQIRSFVPGQDDAAWLGLNATAFADHPEQGQLTQEDLTDRINSDWFDASGFFLAERTEDSTLLGFHWTKFPPNQQPEQLGEVYAVGISPQAQGTGLGKVLTAAGIQYLREAGADAVILYVDASNQTAVGLYERLGFTIFDADDQYAPAG